MNATSIALCILSIIFLPRCSGQEEPGSIRLAVIGTVKPYGVNSSGSSVPADNIPAQYLTGPAGTAAGQVLTSAAGSGDPTFQYPATNLWTWAAPSAASFNLTAGNGVFEYITGMTLTCPLTGSYAFWGRIVTNSNVSSGYGYIICKLYSPSPFPGDILDSEIMGAQSTGSAQNYQTIPIAEVFSCLAGTVVEVRCETLSGTTYVSRTIWNDATHGKSKIGYIYLGPV